MSNVPSGVPAHLVSPGESVVKVAHPTRLVVAPLILLSVVVTALAIWIWYDSGAPFVLYAGFIVDTILFAFIAREVLVLTTSEYVLTDRRIIKQTGILNKNSVDAWLEKVNNVEHRQSLLGRLAGYGDVIVDTASETGTTVFPSISAPLEFKRAIIDAVQGYRESTRHAPAPAAPSAAQRLRELKALLDDGLISAEEYAASRQKLMSEL